MKTVNIHAAKTHFSKLIRKVAEGGEVVITNRGVPVARLVPAVSNSAERPIGKYQGQVVMADDFDAPLPEDIMAAFEGRDTDGK